MHKTAAWFVGGLLAAVLLALVFTLGYVSNDHVGHSGSSNAQTNSDNTGGQVDFSTIQQIVSILKDEYAGSTPLDEQQLYEAAISGMLDSLADTGTFYVDPTSYQLSLGPSGSFDGIGATVNQQDQNIVIVSPFEGSPAQAAGLVAGDVILAVDGESIVGWSLDRAVLKVRGPRGSDVTLTIQHLDGSVEDYTIVRDEIQVATVSTVPPGGALKDENGDPVNDLQYMRISQFTEHTPDEVEKVAADAEQSGKRGLIIDLRGNPGGLFNETLDTTDLFLNEGVMLIEVDENGNELAYRATPGGAALNIPIVILMGPLSASGSEVFAAALKDNGRAIIIGQQSYGKGTVNRARQLSDGGALFVTIRHWLTPKGVQIDHVGIKPDIEVSPGIFDPSYDPYNDIQVFSAIDNLHGLQASAVPTPAAAQ